MIIVDPSFDIIDHSNLVETIELAARKCYKSEDQMGPGSGEKLIAKLKNVLKHESVLEHGCISVSIINDRGVSHEEVRHRIAAFSQESTRYCLYSKEKFGEEISVIDPFFFDPNEETIPVIVPFVTLSGEQGKPTVDASNGQAFMMNSFDVWFISCMWAEWGYMTLVNQFKRKAQEARSVLPNSLKTELMLTANPREWLHILKLRTSSNAHPQIREVMVPIGWEFAKRWPCLFGEFGEEFVQHERPAKMVDHYPVVNCEE